MTLDATIGNTPPITNKLPKVSLANLTKLLKGTRVFNLNSGKGCVKYCQITLVRLECDFHAQAVWANAYHAIPCKEFPISPQQLDKKWIIVFWPVCFYQVLPKSHTKQRKKLHGDVEMLNLRSSCPNRLHVTVESTCWCVSEWIFPNVRQPLSFSWKQLDVFSWLSWWTPISSGNLRILVAGCLKYILLPPEFQ